LSEKAYDIRVSGKVQRTGYRRLILESAQELGLRGHVRNEPDGSVAIFVQGEEELVKQFLEMIKDPQAPISVKSFEPKDAELNPNVKFFDVEFGSLAEELQEGFGSMEKEFRDYRGEFRSFAERTDENFETLAQKYGEISEKLTQVLETLQRESAETRRELTRAVDALTELVKRFIGQ
jgi:acylphosphatase